MEDIQAQLAALRKRIARIDRKYGDPASRPAAPPPPPPRPDTRYIEELLAGKSGPRGADFNMRWVASMVADVHRIVCRGGVFIYPLDAKIRDKGGKLRLMYEANPMAFIVEQAGGMATDGHGRILDIVPQSLHQRVPVFLGSKNEIERVTQYHREEPR